MKLCARTAVFEAVKAGKNDDLEQYRKNTGLIGAGV